MREQRACLLFFHSAHQTDGYAVSSWCRNLETQQAWHLSRMYCVASMSGIIFTFESTLVANALLSTSLMYEWN
jgi:hypothetical protein